MSQEAKRKSGDLPTLVLAVAIALLIRTFIFQSFYVPSDSMLPTMLVGDHVFVNKLAYGPRVPFTEIQFPGYRKPERGEVVVFNLGRSPRGIHPADQRPDLPTEAFVKRVVGLPGDRVEVRGGRVYLNGEPVPTVSSGETFTGSNGRLFDIYIETLGECRHRILDDPQQAGIDMPPRTVKPGRYLFLGDNRDNSYDGRKFGTVRLAELEGPAGLLYWSWDWNGSWLSLLNPWTWWQNLTSKTRWGRIGSFHECIEPGDQRAAL
jgi:signal peptidase I